VSAHNALFSPLEAKYADAVEFETVACLISYLPTYTYCAADRLGP
jgi:hypothetical protein